MPSRYLEIERGVLTYTPVSMEDIDGIHVPIPQFLGNSSVKAEFMDRVVGEVKRACGSSACGACVVFESSRAKAICYEENCPMDPLMS
jgi:hypothetical protein